MLALFVAPLGAARAEGSTATTPASTKPEKHDGLKELTLDELMNVEVVAPTKAPQPLRQAPGVVTVVTREEILRSGARDLIDVLHLVPGFAFGVDVQNAVSAGFRGNWAEEGKILVLLDGQELNETLYLTAQFGNRFPLDQIDRIEVIRGPGSVVHGGYAELAVIDIVTRKAQQIDGASVSGTYGQMGRTYGRRTLSVAAGLVFESSGLGVTVGAFVGQGHRSTSTYRDLYGNAYDLTDAGRLDPLLFNVGAVYEGLSARLLVEDYRTTNRDAFDRSLLAPVATDFASVHFELKYERAIGDRLTAIPRIAYKRQRPWRSRDLGVGRPLYYDKAADRWTAGTTLRYAWTKVLALVGGLEAYHDRAWLGDRTNVGVGLQRPLGPPFWTFAVFSEVLATHWLVNASLGARYEYNTRFGHALVPRAGLTRAFGRLNTKLLFSQAFKAPGHENYALNPEIEPERTTVWEMESTYRLGEHVSLGANLFDLTIRDPIVYLVDPTSGSESYANQRRTGTRGVEAEARFKASFGDAGLRYSFYDARGKNEVSAYAVPGHPDVLRGFPKHKVTFDAGATLLRHLVVSPSVVWLGRRYGALDLAPNGEPRVGAEGPTLLLNLFVAYRDLLFEGLELGAGGYNLLDAPFRFLQPHDSRHAPLPGSGREWVARLTYQRPFDR